MFATAGRATDFSQAVGAAPIQVLPGSDGMVWQRIWNVAPSGGPTAWCSRSLQANLRPFAAGSFPLNPGDKETFSPPNPVPNSATWCVSGSSTMAVPLTIENGR